MVQEDGIFFPTETQLEISHIFSETGQEGWSVLFQEEEVEEATVLYSISSEFGILFPFITIRSSAEYGIYTY